MWGAILDNYFEGRVNELKRDLSSRIGESRGYFDIIVSSQGIKELSDSIFWCIFWQKKSKS